MVKKEFLRSILAGVYISLAGVVFLKVGGILGAILFGFGLLGVIQTGSLLYTGRIFWEDDLRTLGGVLGGNILGCFLVGSIVSYSYPELKETAEVIINSRINDNLPAVFMKGSFCGLIMTTAVMGAKEKNWYPLLLGIPVFILSGFYHSVADAFYFMLSPKLDYLMSWIFIVFGNWIGGKLYFLWIAK